MFALILRHKSTVGKTPSGVLILHKTHQPILMGETPLSRVLLNHYVHGIRFFEYDRTVYKRKERVIPPKNFEKFTSTAPLFYVHSNMTLEQVSYAETKARNIRIDNISYNLKEI